MMAHCISRRSDLRFNRSYRVSPTFGSWVFLSGSGLFLFLFHPPWFFGGSFLYGNPPHFPLSVEARQVGRRSCMCASCKVYGVSGAREWRFLSASAPQDWAFLLLSCHGDMVTRAGRRRRRVDHQLPKGRAQAHTVSRSFPGKTADEGVSTSAPI